MLAPEAAADAGDAGAGTCTPSPQVRGDLDPLWSTVLGLGSVSGVAADPSGNVVVAGAARGPLTIGSTVIPVGGAFVIGVDRSGEHRWHRVFGDLPSIDAVGVDAAGNTYVGGGTYNAAPDLGLGPVTGTIFVAKLDSSGSTVWATGYDLGGEPLEGPASALAVDPGRAVAIAGNKTPGFVTVFDDAGKLRYAKRFEGIVGPGGAAFDSMGNLTLTGAFGANVGGATLDLGASLAASSPIVAFAAKLDASGNVLWQLTDGSYSVGGPCASMASGTFFAGSFSGSAGIANSVPATGSRDLFLAGLDNGGHPIFERTIPNGGYAVAALAANPQGGVVAAGGGGMIDLGLGEISEPGVLLAKFDSMGRNLLSASFPSPFLSSAGASSVAVTPSGEIVLGGTFTGTIDLGTGQLRSPPSLEFPPPTAMFLARYAQQPGPSFPQRTPCPIVLDGGLPPGARAIARTDVTGDIALSPQSVYWTTGGEVMSAPLSGGDPVPQATGQKGSAALAIDSQSIYWVNTGTDPWPSAFLYGPGGDGSIMSMALDGGAPRVLASSQNHPSAIAVDDTFVYFTTGDGTSADGGAGAVLSTPIAGGAPAVIVSGIGSGEAVAARGGEVAFAATAPADGGAAGSVIGRVPRAGGAWTSLATIDRSVASIALSDTTVYWVETSTQGVDTTYPDGRIRSVPLSGGPVSLLADNQPTPGKIVLLGANLYWANANPTNTSTTDRGIMSVPLGGGAPAPVLPTVQWASVFAIDDTHLAWAGAEWSLDLLTR